MHPIMMAELATMRHAELLRLGEDRRRARGARPGAGAGSPGIRRSLQAALGTRMVAVGWRLLDAGLPHAQAAVPGPCDEPC